MSDPTWLDYVAAAATTASAGVIAWQAWQTRAAVRASERTVEAAQESVTVAAEALRESQLARLEAAVPRITVSTPPWPELTTSTMPAPTAEEKYQRRAVTPSDVFKLPRDAELTLSVSHHFVVRNDGPGSVTVNVQPFAIPDAGTPEVIAPGTERGYSFTVRHTVEEWVEILEMIPPPEEGKPRRLPPAHTTRVTYVGPRDADVTEVHEVVVSGSLLRPVPDAKGDWNIDLSGWDYDLSAKVLPATRTYWRSRSNGEKF